MRNNHEFFMLEALSEAQEALNAGEFPVGCVITHNDKVIVTGQRLNTSKDCINETDHAEINALKKLDLLPGEIDRSKAVLYCTMEPCLMCYAAIILSGIRRIIFAYEDTMGGGTGCDLNSVGPLYKNSDIKVTGGVLRKNSLKLFQDYFSNPENDYWEGSLLATYTLEQKL